MNDNLDRYYTPLSVANNILEKAEFNSPEICVDPTCGSGNLLAAASNIYGKITCFGIDKDKTAISSLKRRQPQWNLSVADLLKENSYRKTTASTKLKKCDLLLLNPPFSHFKNKHVDISYQDHCIKGSIAMAYLLKSIELFEPTQGALVIAPESLLYSQTDEHARYLISQNFKLEHIQDLENKTFDGARVHTSSFKLTPSTHSLYSQRTVNKNLNILRCNIVRGALPVYKSKHNNGIGENTKFLHSTDLKHLYPGNTHQLKTTNSKATGRVYGDVILIPRVGVPNKNNVNLNNFKDVIQLSDCVIAIQSTESYKSLNDIHSRIMNNWESFSSLYRGTAARYITISRLQEWLLMLNIRT